VVGATWQILSCCRICVKSLGIIFLANMELGFLAPPVGLNLLLASYRFNKPMPEVTRASFPMLCVMVVGVLLITYVPWLTTWLPGIWK
jgi:TRAP-type C4-dicarboxylate transport system permease large subunit